MTHTYLAAHCTAHTLTYRFCNRMMQGRDVGRSTFIPFEIHLRFRRVVYILYGQLKPMRCLVSFVDCVCGRCARAQQSFSSCQFPFSFYFFCFFFYLFCIVTLHRNIYILKAFRELDCWLHTYIQTLTCAYKPFFRREHARDIWKINPTWWWWSERTHSERRTHMFGCTRKILDSVGLRL